ncbi:TetR/AcrR family transcriptional regulator [Algiphilus sp.]|uniref:TetR/AcrR family transcriptional regulator n=1 Tax=Algiphilus sp. TaxID=1872431 RepID=UPI0025C6749B|nr:TetR/AcrR family transcriptional regulator [Algiphilus sp.]MCK5771630.1 TetR/AcrR family transcriptional regulator [Algiphilus sp.]
MSIGSRLRSRRETRKRATRQLILDAGCAAFAEIGYDATTIRDIVRRTDLASGTFYNYFDTKEEVLRELVGDEIARLTERMQEARRRASNLHNFVLSAYREAFRAVVARPELFKTMLRNESVVRSLFAETGFGNSLSALREDMRSAVDRGILPDMNVDWLASIFFGTAYEMSRNLLDNDGGPAEAEAAAEFTARLFLGGIQAFSDNQARSFKLRLRPPSRTPSETADE